MARPKRTQLTPEQKLYAEYELTPRPEREQVQDFCEKVGVSREALRLWREKPEYIEYKTRLKVALIESHYSDIIESMAGLAKSGQSGAPAAARILLDHSVALERNEIERKQGGGGGPKFNIVIGRDRGVYDEAEIIENDEGGNGD